LRLAVEVGYGAAMLAALDQARAWWDAYDMAQRMMGDEDNQWSNSTQKQLAWLLPAPSLENDRSPWIDLVL